MEAMSNQTYPDLLQSIAMLRNLGEEDGEILRATGGLWVDEVYFYLLEDEESDIDTVCVYAIFGVAPQEKEAEVLRAIMEENAAMFAFSGPIFMINSQDGNVMLAHRYALSLTTPEDMVSMMDFVAMEAMKWRKTYYLEETTVPPEEAQASLNHNFV
jgi:hypothetical protein